MRHRPAGPRTRRRTPRRPGRARVRARAAVRSSPASSGANIGPAAVNSCAVQPMTRGRSARRRRPGRRRHSPAAPRRRRRAGRRDRCRRWRRSPPAPHRDRPGGGGATTCSCRSSSSSSLSRDRPARVHSTPASSARAAPLRRATSAGCRDSAPEWLIAAENSPVASGETSRAQTEPPPADCPAMVTRPGRRRRPRCCPGPSAGPRSGRAGPGCAGRRGSSRSRRSRAGRRSTR